MNSKRINIFWFRRDLRLSDNNGLYQALSAGLEVIPIFIFDKNILDILEDRKDHRVTFIHNTIHALNQELNAFGSSIMTFYADPEEVFRILVKEYNVETVFTNRDYEPYSISRDQKVKSFLSESGVQFSDFKDHIIYEKTEVAKDDGLPYTVFTPYKKKWLQKLNKNDDLSVVKSEERVYHFLKMDSHSVISLSEMNFEKSKITASPLDVNHDIISQYDTTRNFPGQFRGTSKLGVHLRFGTLGIRRLAQIGKKLNDTFLSELIWRDFYSQILSNFPHVAKSCFRIKYEEIEWENDEEMFRKWCDGQTGYPLVDAGMRELNATGYMHNRVRMVASSFLTKHLLIDYKWGEAYFAQKLFDFDLASNNGGWQWAAGCGTDAAPYFRIFNPTSQLQKFDKDLNYTKKWVPEIDTFDYVKPIVDHKTARLRCLERYKSALNR